MNTPNSTNTRPEFIRFPRPSERCPLTGLSRPYLYDLKARGLIKTVSLRARGKARGVCLIVADSLVAFINSHADQSAKGAA